MDTGNTAKISFYNQKGEGSAHALLFAETENTLFVISDKEMGDYSEARIQLLEGMAYEYKLSDESFFLAGKNGLISRSRVNRNTGRITPGLNVGRLPLALQSEDGAEVAWGEVEVRSRKVGYREDYRRMLEYITEQSMDLLFELRSPAQMGLLPDPGKSPETIAQRFAFIRSLLSSRQFKDALSRVTNYPHLRCEAVEEIRETRKGFRGSAAIIRQLARGTARMPVSKNHPLEKKLPTLPRHIVTYQNRETVDTVENQFIKYALNTFAFFLKKMSKKLEAMNQKNDSRLRQEVCALEKGLNEVLRKEFFREVSELRILPLGSPVLQRKGGYREILQAWLKFNMAARLVWSGGDDVYFAGKRDVAILYEYWLFFKLMKLVCGLLDLDKPVAAELLEKTQDGFGLKLKSGSHLPIKGICHRFNRSIAVCFSYNRTFTRKGSVGADRNYPRSGSWTERMRPDYTLSLWPDEFTESEAEEQELMVHVHFDAKYRIENIDEIFGTLDMGKDDTDTNALTDNLLEEKKEQMERKYKRADLLKMHAYRDAIRRSAGAYVIYPGHKNKNWRGFHEIIPGLGAFAIRPAEEVDDGTEALAAFMEEVVKHICNRASSRERHTFHTYKIHENRSTFIVPSSFPEKESVEVSRHTPPAETQVLVGWCKSDSHYDWIKKEGKYNFRMNSRRGSLRLTPEVSGAKYLLLHTKESKAIDGLLRIKSTGPRVFSKQALKDRGYPDEPNQEYYLVFDIEPDRAFDGYSWDYKVLHNKPTGRLSSWPFAVTLDKLLTITDQCKTEVG